MKTVNKLLAKLPDEVARQVPDVKLLDQDIKVSLAQGTFTQENILPPKLNLTDFTLSFEAGGEASIRNFNSPGDVDENRVVGEAAQDEAAPGAPRPQLLLGGDMGWMRYQVSARVKSAAGVNLSFLAAGTEGELSVTLSDYRAHPLAKNMREAAKGDLAELRLMQATDLAKLATGDALSWQARGHLQTRVELNWADLFTANLSRLAFVRGSELLALKTDIKAGVSAKVGLTDDYQLTFSRPRPGRIGIAMRKAKSREATLGAGLGVTVEFVDVGAVKAQLGHVLDALLGPALKELAGKPGTPADASAVQVMDALVDKASKLKLDDLQKKALAFALDRIGLDPKLAELANVKTAWDDFKKKVEGKLDEVLKTQIASGFQHEYLRLSESSTLLEVVVDDATAMRFHGSLIKGNLVDLLKWMRELPENQKSFELKNYLHTASLTRQQAYGFSLGLGSFEVLKAQGSRKESWVTQENFQGARRQAFVGRRGYEDKLLGNRGQWVVDLKADMERFSPAPVASDFRYGLHLMLWGRQKKMTRKEFQAAIDDAVVWGVLDAADAAAVMDTLQVDLGKEPIETRLELKMADDTFRALVPKVQEFDLGLFSRALARAMPWSEQTARASAEFRRAVYAPIWEAYLREVQEKGSMLVGDLSTARTLQIVEHFLKREPMAMELLTSERDVSAGGIFSFAQVTQRNSGTLAKCQSFVSGMVRLRRAIDERKAPDELRAVFSELECMWNTGFHLRAAGSLLAELSRSTPLGLAGVERTFSVTLADRGEQLVFSTTRGTGG
ncbi:hypothetical protein ACLESD_12325 [Pyxidicoccus sp. 3LFB2]